jgi:hypothetical protein
MGKVVIRSLATKPIVADYYVAKTGNDTTGDGSQENPWLTIQKAANTVSAGDVVGVKPGIYDERVTILATKSGTAGDRTRFVADGDVVVAQGFSISSAYTDLVGFEVTPGAVTIDGNTDAEWRGQVFIEADNVTVEDFYIHDTYNSAIAVLQTLTGPTLIKGCTIDKSARFGITSAETGTSGTSYPANVTVRDCTISKFCGDVGIRAYGDNWLIEDCTITGPTTSDYQKPSQGNGDGIQVNMGTGTTIRRCHVYDIWSYRGYASGQHADCIQIWKNVTDLTVEACVFGTWKPGGYDNSPGPTNAIMLGGCVSDCDVTFQNCVFCTGIAAGTSVTANTHPFASGVNSGYTLTVRLYNNTFFANAPALNGGGTHVWDVRNNVFYAHRGTWFASGRTASHNAFMWNQWGDASLSGLQDSTLPTGETSPLGSTYETRLLAAEAFVDPDVSASSGYGLDADFSLKAGSALSGAGVYDAALPQTDIAGAARSNPPSIGAYE